MWMRTGDIILIWPENSQETGTGADCVARQCRSDQACGQSAGALKSCRYKRILIRRGNRAMGAKNIASTLLTGALGLALLYFGGEQLVRAAASLALRLGLSPLVVGLTVVAMGTSMPELVVSLDAALGGANDIAVGNVVGSNIANLALVLGMCALLSGTKIQATLVKFDGPVALFVALVMLELLRDGIISRLEGVTLLIGLVAYVAVTSMLGPHESKQVQDEFAGAVPLIQTSLRTTLLRLAGGIIGLAAGGHFLVVSAVDLATSWGLSQAVIGITVVAIGTSLPEMATTLIAASRGQNDMAVGNLIGSNIFNTLGILGTTALVQPLTRGDIGWDSLWIMVAFTATLIPMMYTGLRVSRFEGAALVSAYIGYLGWLILN